MKFFIGKKKAQSYKGLLVKADEGLHEKIAEEILHRVPKGGIILDLGAGEGALSERLFDLGYHVVAADKDPRNFRCRSAKFTEIDFDSSSELENFVSSHEKTFDAVLGVEVIEHVKNQWQYVKQLVRMTKPGGLILITTPNTTSWLSRFIFLISGRFHQFSDGDLSYGHISPITPWELNMIMSDSGVDNITVASAGTLPPIYITGLNKLLIINFFALLVRPFQKGIIDGWCIVVSGRKKT